MAISTIGIIGGGAWGTALAIMAQTAGLDTIIWAREAEVAQAINQSHENTVFLPGVKLNPTINATNDLSQAAAQHALLVVTPAQHTRAILQDLKPLLRPGTLVAMCSKGIEQGTHKFMSQVLAETLPSAEPAILSGPSFAAEVARNLPTAVTLAGKTLEAVEPLAEALKGPTFRPYLSDDMIGAQIGGAVKNVLAIACGIVEGRKLGVSAKAALMTRGFAEIIRLGRVLGAKPETLRGLSGLGDLILTCSSSLSRNMSLGLALGEGQTLDQILNARQSVTEGVHTAGVVIEIANTHNIDMPICESVHMITSQGADIDQTISDLLNRPLRTEDD